MTGDELELRIAWLLHVGRSTIAERWFESVLALHRGPDRHYHVARHVCWVVRHVGTLASAGLVDDHGAVVAASFFHDAVYDARRSDSEASSARVAVVALGEIGWPVARRDRVAAMIEATDHRRAEGGADRDTAVLLAADLAVLAAEPARYGDYLRAVRREYAHVDADAWRVGRSAVLRSFLDRAWIYEPALGLAEWERRARANITAELATLAD